MMYWILLIFLVIGFFYPVIGFIALICMVGPVVVSLSRGRYWCGNVCPRGSLYDQLVRKISPQKPIPAALRSEGFRRFAVAFIFVVFGVQMYAAWGDPAAMGGVFIRIIFWTTVVGILLSFVFHQRTWCSFCPMGTLSAWVAPKGKAEGTQGSFQVLRVEDDCVRCGLCAKECPMQLKPYEAKGNADGFVHADCLKCGKCIARCPKKALRFE